jgi:hypothetical protein
MSPYRWALHFYKGAEPESIGFHKAVKGSNILALNLPSQQDTKIHNSESRTDFAACSCSRFVWRLKRK